MVCMCCERFLQQVSAAFGRKSWKLRWAALVPNALLVFGSDSRPKPGTPAKEIVVLEHASLEGVDEIEAKRKYVFCVGTDSGVRIASAFHVMRMSA